MNIDKYTKKELFELLKNERNELKKIKGELEHLEQHLRCIESEVIEKSEEIMRQENIIKILTDESVKRGRAVVYLGKMLAENNSEKLFLELKQAMGQKEKSCHGQKK